MGLGMLAQFFGVWFLMFCLGIVPPVALKRMNENVFYRTIAATAVISAVLVFGKFNYAQNLLIAGIFVCGAVTLAGIDKGVKSLFGEIIILCVLMGSFVWTEFNAVFSGDVDYLLTKVQRFLNGQGFPLEVSDLGRFTLGGAIGVLAAAPVRIALRKYLEKREESLSTLKAREARRNKIPVHKRAITSAHQAMTRKQRTRNARIARALGTQD